MKTDITIETYFKILNEAFEEQIKVKEIDLRDTSSINVESMLRDAIPLLDYKTEIIENDGEKRNERQMENRRSNSV